MAVHVEPEEAFGTGGKATRDAAAQRRVYALMHVYDWAGGAPRRRGRLFSLRSLRLAPAQSPADPTS